MIAPEFVFLVKACWAAFSTYVLSFLIFFMFLKGHTRTIACCAVLLGGGFAFSLISIIYFMAHRIPQ